MALNIQQTRPLREDRCVDYKTPELEDGLFAASQSTLGEWCEIKGIIAEKHTKYRVLWVGVDPQTGLPWKPEWVKKEAVTEDARTEWEDKGRALAERYRGQRRKRRRGAGANKSPAKRPCTFNWPEGQRHKQQKEPARTATQNSEYYPSQSFANYKYSSSPLRSTPHLLPAERPPQALALLVLSPNSPSHVSQFLHVLIDTPVGFNPKAYAWVSDTVLVPSTQYNGFASDTCEKAAAQLLDAPDDRVEYTQLSTVIPDSQAFDDTRLSAFVESSVDHLKPETVKREHEYIPATYSSPEKGSLEREESSQVEETVKFPVQSIDLETPPPSYEESTFRSSNHTLEVQFEPTIQVAEAAVQTDLPFEEELKLVENDNESAPQSNKQEQGSQESSIFDLDLPQDPGLSYRTEPSPETSDAGEPLQGGDPYSINGISRDFESPRPSKNLAAETRIADPSEQEDANSEGGPQEATAGEASLDSALQQEALEGRPEAQELIEHRRDRRQGSRLGDWFRNSTSPGRPTTGSPSGLLPAYDSSGFPFPPKSFSAYTESGYLRPPYISPSMSETLSPPSAPVTLREKLAARRKALDEEIARRRAAISSQATPQPSSASGLLSPNPPSTLLSPPSALLSPNPPSAQSNQQPPTIGLLPDAPEIPPQSDQDAQLLTHQPPAPRSHHIDSTISAATSQPPVQTEEPTRLAQPTPLRCSQAFRPPLIGVDEYAIGLPLSTKTLQAGGLSQKSVYLNAIAGKHADVEAYLTNPEGASAELAESVFELLRSAAQIAAHPNTICPIAVSRSSDEKEAEFHTVMSAKFQFLRDLFSLIADEMVKIAVVAEAPALIDMLEVFFRGIKVQYSRLDKSSTLPPVSEDDLEGMVQVLLVPSDGGGAVGSECHLIIAMDSTFNSDIYEVQQMRKDMYDPAKQAPVLRLVAINTIEHVLLCVAMVSADNLRACMEAVKILRNDVGVLDPTYAAASRSAAVKIREWIRGGCTGHLEVPLLPALPMFDTIAATATQVGVTEKRKREVSSLPSEATNADPKKRKVLDQPTSSEPQAPLEADNTRITSAMSSQLPHGPEAVSPQREDMDIDNATPMEPQFLMRDPAQDTFSRDQLLSPAHQQEDRLRSYMVSEDRHAKSNETLRQDIAKLKAEIRRLEKTVDKADAENNRLIADKRKMESKHADLKAQLAKALESLNSDDLTSTHGKLLSENMELKKKVEHFQHKVESTERDAQFAREQYQTASNSIYEVRQENEELLSTCETLKRKADDNIATLRRMNYDFGVSRRDDEMERLKAQLKESEERVGRLELEKANTFRKGVLGTRSMSVPKRGSPAQSRASSPNVVSITHPLRNRQEPSH